MSTARDNFMRAQQIREESLRLYEEEVRNHKRAYANAHRKVASQKGRAAEHSCVDCGKQAIHWSYDHEDPNEFPGIQGSNDFKTMAYSMDVSHYHPRCMSCHKRFDKIASRATHRAQYLDYTMKRRSNFT